MKTSPSEEWQVRVLRMGLIAFSSFFIMYFFLSVMSLGNLTSNQLLLCLLITTLLSISSLFFKVPSLRFEFIISNGRRKLSTEWKYRILRAILITFTVYIAIFILAGELVEMLGESSNYKPIGYEGGAFVWSVFIGLASILFEAPSRIPSLKLSKLSPNERVKIKKIALFYLSIFIISNLLLYLIPAVISGYFPALILETLFWGLPSSLMIAMVFTMGYILLFTSKSSGKKS